MAGAGYKLYTTGDVLSASDVNTYLQQQTVMVFASAAARTTALASVLAEGMVTYLKDTDVVEIYTGAAWVSLDDPNAIQNSIVTTKGDIIGATAASTPARLAVGANGTILTADSGETTGLKYAGNWVTFTPAAINGFTLGNGTIDARYCRVGKVTFVYFRFTLGSTSAITGAVNFQVAAGMGAIGGQALNGTVTYIDAGTASYNGSIETTVGGGTLYMRVTNVAGTWGNPSFDISATAPFTWGTADSFTGYLWYEVQ